MGTKGLDSTLKYSTLTCTPYKIAHVNCAKPGDMEIAHVNVLKIAHHFPV